MTNATVHTFVEELKKLNPEQASNIQVGSNFEQVVYTGGDPRKLIIPAPFAWDEEQGGFSDLETLRDAGMALLYQVFFVKCK